MFTSNFLQQEDQNVETDSSRNIDTDPIFCVEHAKGSLAIKNGKAILI